MAEQPDDDERAENDRFTKSLLALAVAVALVVIGFFLLDRVKMLQDLDECLMNGRKHCAAAQDSGDN